MNEKFMRLDRGRARHHPSIVAIHPSIAAIRLLGSFSAAHVAAQGCVGRRSLLAPASLLVYSNCKFFVEFFFSINLRRMCKLSRDCRVGDDVNSLVVNLFISFN